jgi:cytoskeletal protein RodZ
VPGFGSKLMLKRLALGFSLRDAAKISGLKQKELRALEDEDLLRFRDKDQIAELLIIYAATLDLNKTEIKKDLELVWSDASTAKNYMQQEYNNSKKVNIFGSNPLIGYGIAVGAAVLLLSVGGYFYFNNIAGGQGPLQEQFGLVTNDGHEPVPAATQTQPDLSGSNEQAEHSTIPVSQDESAAESNNSGVLEVTEPIEPAEHVAAGESSDGLPRASGSSYILWVGLLTFLTGLLLFGLPSPARKRKVTADIGVFV